MSTNAFACISTPSGGIFVDVHTYVVSNSLKLLSCIGMGQ